MDQRPVSEPGGSPPSWRLAKPHDSMTQGLVVSGFASLPTGRALFLEFGWSGVHKKGGGDWLRALAEIAPDRVISGIPVRDGLASVSTQGIERLPDTG